jgi:hypothetical protein
MPWFDAKWSGTVAAARAAKAAKAPVKATTTSPAKGTRTLLASPENSAELRCPCLCVSSLILIEPAVLPLIGRRHENKILAIAHSWNNPDDFPRKLQFSPA